MDTQVSVRNFLVEIMSQLVYNIVNKADNVVNYSDLYHRFKQKTGFEMEEFLDLYGNDVSEDDLMDVIRDIPGLKFDEDDDIYVVDDGSSSCSHSKKLSQHRGKILISCAKLLIYKDETDDINKCFDESRNTALHILITLPGISDDRNLLKNLFNAGVNPFAVNEEGKTFLHVLFGECYYKSIGHIFYNIPKRAYAKLFDKDREAVLELVTDRLSPAEVASLCKMPDKEGNTVLHYFALSTSFETLSAIESTTCRMLIELDEKQCLRIPNTLGNVPLHYTFNPSIFSIFAETQNANYIARNDNGETPVFYILKTSVSLAFAQTVGFSELKLEGLVGDSYTRDITTANKLLQNLKNIITVNNEAMKTVWSPDNEDNVAIDIILIAIRIASYCMTSNMSNVYVTLTDILHVILSKASKKDLQRKNNRGHSFFHLLLDIKKNVIKENYIIQAIDILRKYNVDYDGDGCTVKDKINGFKETSPTLYKKCVELLFSKIDASNDNNDSPLAEWRKLRSCPPRHTHSANRLMNENGPTITVVGKFRYFLEEPIGFGAFSSIYVAIKDEQFNEESGTMQCRPFALKRIDKAKINPEEIKRETTALISLSGKCENIIRYHDSLEDTFFQYLVLDLMDGDLNEFVGNREASVVLGNGVEAVKQIINGLAFLHENGYIHRDLKPGNILYTRYPRLDFKISDFGLAKNISASSTMMSTRGNPFSTAAGSRCWMAPELVSMKSSEHTKQSDIFSLGLILHYLMSFGKHPFATPGDERPHVVERNIEEMNGNLKNDLHPEAKSFLLTLLNVEPSNRPTAAHLNKHSYPFLWSVHKKIEFLKAVGDQNEARNPAKYPNSELEELLEKTQTCEFIPWDEEIKDLYEEMTEAWSQKKYREDKVIDLVRFIRNAYAHREERSVDLQEQLENSVFLFKFPPLVVDVFDVVQQAGLHSRSAIKVALES
ncbi:uncharacterized protein LOC124437572 isoform X1 [Xenia sp. Carnegie-2017]|uniref:uncharacterized protein LOC124437572 isoform X1 n=1 Tax=Xenia sp. Carnegie-2017 TaxID=2897299 RepID=UPI001F04E776|nr:uncharacterized protein LOC124437572 isoform X1 [Xenia sp. Carnegie-2017]